MNFNLYAERIMAEQRRAEQEERAENHRLAQQVVKWLKQQNQDTAKAQTETMRKPELSIYEN
ncbi:MAG: hypothetical protein SF123_09450 [Chloroflexota bacterium]|nr:hypothetical protein [Chloroflexota bacterium]